MMDTILIVEDDPMILDLQRRNLSEAGYACSCARSAEAARTLLGRQSFALALLDINLPGISGVALLQELRRTCPDTVVIMVTAVDQLDTALHCIQAGAEDYILKPFNLNRIQLSIRGALEKRRLRLENRAYQLHLEHQVAAQTAQLSNALAQLQLTYDTTLRTLARALDAREKEVGSHSERVQNYSLFLAKVMGLGSAEQEDLAKGSLLHDIGKIGISDNILLKPAKLTEVEWQEMKKHPKLGRAIIEEIPFLQGAAQVIQAHHERYDGSGYPLGLQGEQIPLGARIFALADTLDAMTSDRPYRRALPFAAVQAEVEQCSGSQFDPEIAAAFLGVGQQQWEAVAGRRFVK
jgi:putative two-component system response regulator